MSLKERINLVKQQFGISEADTLNIEKALGKKLVDYESIEALVAALMGYYNGELKKKANTSHTHDYAPSSHKHKKADISDFPTSMKNPNALEIKMNGQNPVSYDGAAAKSINITASGIGAYTKTETDEKFKNFCPFPVNSLYLSLGNENPSSLWLGTTWVKQEGRFLLGSSNSYSLGSTGGASTVKLAIANLPSHTHPATTAAHTHTQPTHRHAIKDTSSEGSTEELFFYGNKGSGNVNYSNYTSSAGGETTGSASPVTSIGATGSGTAFSIMPPYLVVNIWKRLS